jgi:hypothetical protein
VRFIHKLSMVALITAAILLLGILLGIKSGIWSITAFLGSAFFFMGEFLTGYGFTLRLHYINRPTPEAAWKFLGILCWIITGVWFLYSLLS